MLESIASIGISIPVTDEDVQDTQPTVGWWYKGMSASYSAWDILTRPLRMIAVVLWVFSARVRLAGLRSCGGGGAGGGAGGLPCMATHSQHNWLYKHCVYKHCTLYSEHHTYKGMPLPVYS